MTVSTADVCALALLAHHLGRDLQRAARRAGGPRSLLTASDDVFCAALGVSEADRARVAGVRRQVAQTDAEAVLKARGITAIGAGDGRASPLLAQAFDPPFGVFTTAPGRCAEAWDGRRPVIAIVGSRRAGVASTAFAASLAAGLVRRGAVIVSGLARGVDAAAHRGALDAAGTTIAVLGAGVDSSYPRANRALRKRIDAEGAVVSEYWPETLPAPWRFPARNRIVAGIAHAVVVVDAAATSGALITADFAVELGRPVLAVPHPPWEAGGAGAVNLIATGAAVCRGVDDVVDEVPHPGWTDLGGAVPPTELEGTAARVFDRIRTCPGRLDELVSHLSLEAREVSAALAELELAGLAVVDAQQRWLAQPTH